LRDIETCLASFGPKLYHSASASHRPQHPGDANEKRDWRIFADFAMSSSVKPPHSTPGNLSASNSKPPLRAGLHHD